MDGSVVARPSHLYVRSDDIRTYGEALPDFVVQQASLSGEVYYPGGSTDIEVRLTPAEIAEITPILRRIMMRGVGNLREALNNS